ncbi:MAG TPA: hypothetical protein VK590_02420 [Saprospiraceae bacterium]|nr:hypothetical protein [Saprospiraceae bacterium]
MNKTGQVLMFISLILWGTLIGGVMYSHLVYFPPYLSRLPESNSLITGPFGIQDGHFWMLLHPAMILTLLLTLLANWKLETRRKYILITMSIYALAIISTFCYFVPELKAFADSMHSTIPANEWYQRGQTWQHLSWVRGSFMYLGFVFLLIALTKVDSSSDIPY